MSERGLNGRELEGQQTRQTTGRRSVAFKPPASPSYALARVLVTGLFFMWAIGVHFNDILIPYLKRSFSLSDFQSSLVQTAFFGGYFLAALPASRVMERFGYRRGIVTGLGLCGCGALLFLPAAAVHVYGMFLAALFVTACGQSFLEVAANPYMALLGEPDGAAMRLTVAQGFNAVGAVLTPLIGSVLILARSEQARSGATPLHNPEAEIFRVPYLVLAAVYVAFAVVMYTARLPEVSAYSFENTGRSIGLRGLLRQRRVVWGVVAQFFYVGAQVGAASFVIRLAEHSLPGTLDSVASKYLQYHLIGFMLGRFLGSALMSRIQPHILLGAFAVGALLCSLAIVAGHGMLPVAAIVLLGAFNSIMFPTIFALTLRDLGSSTKLASSLLVMAIIGGAVLPAAMGLISDHSGIQIAFLVPLAAYCFVFYFAAFGCEVSAADGYERIR